jgi:formylglycine-generating enzyme required for sulfatase activity
MSDRSNFLQGPSAFKSSTFTALCQRLFGTWKVIGRHRVSVALLSVTLWSSVPIELGWSAPVSGTAIGNDAGCPPNMAQVGPLCVDKYEATVWSEFPTSDGRPRGIQFGRTGDDYPCSFNGDDCSGANPIYAASVPGRKPSAFITWFQAQQACLNVGKRLLTNAEWQGAAAGTPTDYEPNADDGMHDCNTSTANRVVPAGSRSNCVSNFGVFDMVGNLVEWTADWFQGSSVPFTPSVGTAGPDFGDDFMLGTNPAKAQGPGTNFPSALARGGGFKAGSFSPNGSGAGVFALNARFSPADSADDGGFRCGR